MNTLSAALTRAHGKLIAVRNIVLLMTVCSISTSGNVFILNAKFISLKMIACLVFDIQHLSSASPFTHRLVVDMSNSPLRTILYHRAYFLCA
ncbi:hypothetical protein C8R48DRAFT_710097 [Suillus tomentosus]|nr:hypothetical protein C8R48DRAFT_710097 [Suillus tomentosus]